MPVIVIPERSFFRRHYSYVICFIKESLPSIRTAIRVRLVNVQLIFKVLQLRSVLLWYSVVVSFESAMKFSNQVLHFLKKFFSLNCAGFIFCGEKCKLSKQRLRKFLQDSRGCTQIDVYSREHAISPETTSGGSLGPLNNRSVYPIISSKRICVDAL